MRRLLKFSGFVVLVTVIINIIIAIVFYKNLITHYRDRNYPHYPVCNRHRYFELHSICNHTRDYVDAVIRTAMVVVQVLQCLRHRDSDNDSDAENDSDTDYNNDGHRDNACNSDASAASDS